MGTVVIVGVGTGDLTPQVAAHYVQEMTGMNVVVVTDSTTQGPTDEPVYLYEDELDPVTKLLYKYDYDYII